MRMPSGAVSTSARTASASSAGGSGDGLLTDFVSALDVDDIGSPRATLVAAFTAYGERQTGIDGQPVSTNQDATLGCSCTDARNHSPSWWRNHGSGAPASGCAST